MTRLFIFTLASALLLWNVTCSAQSFTTSHGTVFAEHGVGMWVSGSTYYTFARAYSDSGAAYSGQVIAWDANDGSVTSTQALSMDGTVFLNASASIGNQQVVVGSVIPTDSSLHDMMAIATSNSGTQLWSLHIAETGSQMARCLAELPNGDILIAGTSEDMDKDVFASRISDTGQEIWTTTYPLPGDQEAFSVVIDGTDLIIAGSTDVGAGKSDGFILRADQNGAMLWNSSYGDVSGDRFMSITALPNGDLLCAGTTASYGDTTYLGYRYRHIWLVRTDGSGNVLNNVALGDTLNHRAATTMSMFGGDVLIAGRHDYDPHNDILLQRVTTTGNLVWERVFSYGLDERILSLVPLSGNAGFAGVGWSWTNTGCEALLIRRNILGL